MEEEGLGRKGEPGGCRWEEERGSMGEVDGRGVMQRALMCINVH